LVKQSESNKKYIRNYWIIVVSPVLLIFLLVFASALEWLGKLPTFEELENPKSNLASEIYSSDMKVLGKFYYENRTNVHFKSIDSNLVHALIATEDARFYAHSGVDGRGLLRVFVKTILGGEERSGGGSTITQQLAKMLFPREQNQSKFSMVFRKIKEWIIAARLERQYTKNEIISMYLNKFDFINNAVGIKSATKIYFNTTPDSLKIEQSAMLVGMAKNPALFNPIRRPEQTKQRRNVVLLQMEKYNYITKAQCDSLQKTPLQLNFQPEDHNEGLATYFREYVRDEFMRKWCEENKKPDGSEYNIYKDGLKIYTTINSKMQRYAEEAVEGHLKGFQEIFFKDCKRKKNAPFDWRVTKDEIKSIVNQAMKRSDRYRTLKLEEMPEEQIEANFNTPVPMTVFSWKGDIDTVMKPIDSILYYKAFLQTGFMSMDPHTGFVKAWVGGINHKFFKYDHVKVAKRQVGSTFKPIIYSLAIQEGYSPCYRVPNVPVTIQYDGKEWTPQNSDTFYNGRMVTLQRALALSINYVSAYLMKQFGPQAVVDMAKRMGITSPIEAVPSICLGTPEISLYEMVGANSTFANKGTWIEPVFVTRIEDKNGNVLQDFSSRTEEVMSEEKAYVMLHLLKGVVLYGTGNGLRSKYKLFNAIAGKTGTTQNNSDGWFMGITPDLVSGCWVGCEDRSVHFSSMQYGQGASMALPIWALYMQKVYADKSLQVSTGDFEAPVKKINVELDCSKYDKETEEGIKDFDNDENL